MVGWVGRMRREKRQWMMTFKGDAIEGQYKRLTPFLRVGEPLEGFEYLYTKSYLYL